MGLNIRYCSPDHALQIDSAMFIKMPILGGKNSLLQNQRNLLKGHNHTVYILFHSTDQAILVIENLNGAIWMIVFQKGEIWHLVQIYANQYRQHRSDYGEDQN